MLHQRRAWPRVWSREGDLAKILVASEQTIERCELGKSLGRQGTAFVPTHEAPEPLPQVSRLLRDLVEFAG